MVEDLLNIVFLYLRYKLLLNILRGIFVVLIKLNKVSLFFNRLYEIGSV